MPEQTRQLTAIMFTDIVGYTALMGKDTNRALEIIQQNKQIQKPLVEKYNGVWVKEMGDGTMARFNSALNAVSCAVDIQSASRDDFDADIRIGIHLGDITIESNDVYGDGVNVAARLESIADPGGIYISESIEKAIRGQGSIRSIYLGESILKNVDYGVRTYALQGAGLPIPKVKSEEILIGYFWAVMRRKSMIRIWITFLLVSIFFILLIPYVNSITELAEGPTMILVIIFGIAFQLALYLAWNMEKNT